MDNNELQHVGVLGMKWGRRRSNPYVTTVRGKPVLSKTTVRGKTVTKMDLASKNPYRSRTQKNLDSKRAEKALRLVQDRKMSDFEKRETKRQLKSVAKIVGIGLGVVATVKISSFLADKAVQKIYSGKIADAIGNMLLARRPIPFD